MMQFLQRAMVAILPAVASLHASDQDLEPARYPDAFLGAELVTAYALRSDFSGTLIKSSAEDRNFGIGIDLEELKRNAIGSAALSKKQAICLLDAVYYSKAFHPAKDCYMPHHVFVFREKSGKARGAIEVCLTCSATKQFPGHRTGGYAINNIDFEAVGNLLADLKLPITPYDSREEMEQLLRESAKLGLRYRKETNEEYNGLADIELEEFKSRQEQEITGVEQGGADQPANHKGSESEGEKGPKPEPEVCRK